MNIIKNYTYRDIISIVIIILCIYIVFTFKNPFTRERESFINKTDIETTLSDSDSDTNTDTDTNDTSNIKVDNTTISHPNPKKILITGSSNGIGLFLAIYLLKRGHHVAINGRNSKSLHKLLDKLQKNFTKAKVIAIAADISTSSGCAYLLNTAIKELDGLDILVHNASVISKKAIYKNDSDSDTENDLLGKNKMDWEYQYRTIINGNLYLTVHFIKYIKGNLITQTQHPIKRIYTITSGAVEYDDNVKIPRSYILCRSNVEKMCKLSSNTNTDSNIQIVVLRIDATFNTESTKNNLRDLVPYFNYFFADNNTQNLNGKIISLPG